MNSRLVSRRDPDFLLYERPDATSLAGREPFAELSCGTSDGALDTCDRVAAAHFAPRNRLLDVQEPHFDGEGVCACQRRSRLKAAGSRQRATSVAGSCRGSRRCSNHSSRSAQPRA